MLVPRRASADNRPPLWFHLFQAAGLGCVAPVICTLSFESVRVRLERAADWVDPAYHDESSPSKCLGTFLLYTLSKYAATMPDIELNQKQGSTLITGRHGKARADTRPAPGLLVN